jgi:N-acetylglucosaminyldiphosphoundecaprenol N-acetyl-beta-D-mannosaminyltransferase
MPSVLDRRFVLDLPVDPFTLAQSLERADAAVQSIRAAGPGALPTIHVATLNAEMAMQAQEDAELASILQRCALVVPDGSGVVWALRRQGMPVKKVAGVELVAALAEAGAQRGYRFFFLGAKPGVAQEAVDALAKRFPGLEAVGVRDGYFSAEDEPALLAQIREARPDVLFVALGVPRQEKWIASHLAELAEAGVAIAMGVGGSFDVFAGRVQRAPRAFQKLHLEWLFRLIQEPWRFQRMQSTLPRFVVEVIKRG